MATEDTEGTEGLNLISPPILLSEASVFPVAFIISLSCKFQLP